MLRPIRFIGTKHLLIEISDFAEEDEEIEPQLRLAQLPTDETEQLVFINEEVIQPHSQLACGNDRYLMDCSDGGKIIHIYSLQDNYRKIYKVEAESVVDIMCVLEGPTDTLSVFVIGNSEQPENLTLLNASGNELNDDPEPPEIASNLKKELKDAEILSITSLSNNSGAFCLIQAPDGEQTVYQLHF